MHALVGTELALDDLDLEALEIGPIAGREVVQHAHFVSALDERVHEIRADEPGSAGDECLHPSHFP
jgi:hypothetical protein